MLQVAFGAEQSKSVFGETFRVCRLMRVIGRTMDKHGRVVPVPDIEIEGWWTTPDRVRYGDDTVTGLYRDHGTRNNSTASSKPTVT